MIFHSIYSKRIVFFNQTEFYIYLSVCDLPVAVIFSCYVLHIHEIGKICCYQGGLRLLSVKNAGNIQE
jgi:hypothetical protein